MHRHGGGGTKPLRSRHRGGPAPSLTIPATQSATDWDHVRRPARGRTDYLLDKLAGRVQPLRE
eukprot:50866-Lingulodinium_polyedra.AAC.1